ncbi:MAG: hypothetical protein B1H04_00925 [Planctomycetales bacterium 4484_123]|nr:MAG: hypothetical protein B1H04_00925 [Planctomycetales bacterium 4484_123]
MTDRGEPVGLIAGAGRLPVLVAEGVRQAGRGLVVVAFRGLADPALRGLADRFNWAGVTRVGRWIRLLRRAGVKRAVLAGGVRKAEIYTPFRLLRYLPDMRALRLWYRKLRHDHRDNAVLLAVAGELAGEGIELMSSVEYCREHLASEGPMTRTPVPRKAAADVAFGFDLARRSAALDIGQALAVKEGDIIAVEAIEGTDRMIRRAGELCPSGGWTLVKVARPDQDMRFDVPTVGPETIRNLKAAGGVCLVLEAYRTLILDKPQTLGLADELGIAVVGKRP